METEKDSSMSSENMRRIVEVIGGRFTCDHCGRSWVGTWHGPKSEMTCAWCEKPLVEPVVDIEVTEAGKNISNEMPWDLEP